MQYIRINEATIERIFFSQSGTDYVLELYNRIAVAMDHIDI